MGAIGKRNLANAIIAAAILIGLAYFGLSRYLGAHPVWAVKIGYIGAGFGVVIYSLFWVWRGSWLAKFFTYAILLVIAAGAAYFGKARFVASFAEDVMAGRLWYFGWIAAVGFAFALIMHVLSARN